MIVVSDASPIIALSAVDQLDLLRRLYGKILIPASVSSEIAAGGSGQPITAQALAWIEVRPVGDSVLIRALGGELDGGEAEAIVLALDLQADLLLVDERRARKVATRLGLSVVGVLGVLVEAKQRGFLPAIRPVLEDLLTRAGFRISPDLYALALRTAGEAEA